MTLFKSQAGQDLFALEMSDYKHSGYFLEIGAYHSENMSNTYVLEKQYGWSGLALEIVKDRVDQYNNNRSSKCVCADATTIDYQELLDSNGAPKAIDYLSLDIEPAPQTLKALQLILKTNYSFNAITFEHDLYVDALNLGVKIAQKALLLHSGYTLYKENVCSGNNPRFPFEDWWVK